MIQVSEWFETEMEKPTLNILRKFIYDDIDESERVESFGTISRTSDAIVSGGTSLDLINADKNWNKFITDKTNLRRVAKLQIGLTNGAGEEWIDILTGWGDDPEFSKAMVSLLIRDKFAGLLEKQLGSKEVPLNYYSSAHNPADLAWSILTVHGGLDSTTSSANVDIDYTTWSTWKTACTTADFSFKANLTGQSIREVLELLRDLTNSDIYVGGAGKIKFYRFTPIAPMESKEGYTFSEDSFVDLSVKIDSEKIINYLRIYYGYDPTTEAWAGNYLKEDTASQQEPPDGYGLCSETVEGTTVWHVTLASATSYADWRMNVFKDPLEIVLFTSFMMGMITEIGDIIRITDSFFGYSNNYFRVHKITDLNLNEATISFEAGYFQDIVEKFFLDHETHGLLDQDYNPLG